MTTYLGKSCSFCLPQVPFVNCRQFMYLVISLFGFEGRIWDLIYRFLISAYLFTLQEMRTGIKSWTGSNFGRIWPVILELPALQPWKKWCPHFFSVTFDWVFVKFAGNQDRHKSLNKFEFGSDRIIHFGIICPWAPIFNPRGCIHVLNHEQNCIKSDFKEISLKLATNG